jgi:YesN/AraC family two-component response regulator
VDLRSRPGEPDLCSSLPKTYQSRRVHRIPDIMPAIRDWLPWAVCFEYDQPDARGLDALADIRGRHSSLPIIMLTERHTRRLASWALRRCVWDYLVKPLSVRNLCNCLAAIDRKLSRGQPASFPARIPPAPATRDFPEKPSAIGVLAPAVLYVDAKYNEKIRLATAARLCSLSPFQFSRNFKRENGLTFRDYVVKLRLQRAAELIKDTRASVTEAAFVVGFNDLSYFARMFRKQFGVAPSHFRTESEPSQLLLFPTDVAMKR